MFSYQAEHVGTTKLQRVYIANTQCQGSSKAHNVRNPSSCLSLSTKSAMFELDIKFAKPLVKIHTYIFLH